MSLVVGQNSWATVAEADTYLTNRLGGADWFGLPSTASPGVESKETVLVSAFLWLMSSPEFELSASLTDNNVKNAQIEAGLFLLDHHEELSEREGAIYTGLESFDYSKRSEKFNIKNLTIPAYIKSLLTAYMGGHHFVEMKGEYDEDGD